MIENERQLRHAIETMAKLYSQAEREAAETAWSEETRREMSDDTENLRQNVECEVAHYLVEKHGFTAVTHTLEAVK